MGKVAGQRVTFGASARVGAIAASLAAAAALLLPTTALAATTTEIGSAQGTIDCTETGLTGFNSVQVTSSGDSYAVPAGGTLITSWTVQAGDDTGPVGLEVWQPSTTLTYTLVASTPVETLTANSVTTFPTSINVEAGDLIGLRVDAPAVCEAPTLNTDGTPNFAYSVGFSYGATPAPGGTALMSVFAGFQLDISASVEVTVNPPPPPPTPTSAVQCKHGGWQGLTDSQGTLFKNQGDCVSFVATQGTNLAAG
jgi:hypothetical protein